MLYGGENHRFGNTTVAGKEIKGGELIKGHETIYTPELKVLSIKYLAKSTSWRLIGKKSNYVIRLFET